MGKGSTSRLPRKISWSLLGRRKFSSLSKNVILSIIKTSPNSSKLNRHTLIYLLTYFIYFNLLWYFRTLGCAVKWIYFEQILQQEFSPWNVQSKEGKHFVAIGFVAEQTQTISYHCLVLLRPALFRYHTFLN